MSALAFLRALLREPSHGPEAHALTVGYAELSRLLTERGALAERVDELLSEATAAKDGTLYRMVRRFHERFGHPVRHLPEVPPEEEVRFRLSLITEEFGELLEASLDLDPREVRGMLAKVRDAIHSPYPYKLAGVRVDLPAFVDALADLQYVIEGTSAVFGVRLDPVLREVHRANMEKNPVAVAEKDETHRGPGMSKPQKPTGWVPPDVLGELLKQGWRV